MSPSDLRTGEVSLFPELLPEVAGARTTGVLPSQAIQELIANGRIVGTR